MGKAVSMIGKIIFLILETIAIFFSFLVLVCTFSLASTLFSLGLWYIVVGMLICSILGMFNGAIAIWLFIQREEDDWE